MTFDLTALSTFYAASAAHPCSVGKFLIVVVIGLGLIVGAYFMGGHLATSAAERKWQKRKTKLREETLASPLPADGELDDN